MLELRVVSNRAWKRHKVRNRIKILGKNRYF